MDQNRERIILFFTAYFIAFSVQIPRSRITSLKCRIKCRHLENLKNTKIKKLTY